MSGRLIAFEGGEGSGKTLQAKLLREALAADGVSVVGTREPGGSPSAEAIRDLVLKGDPDRFSGMAELLLMTAARVEHLRQLVLPALERGSTVITDRFYASTVAYQGHGHGMLLEDIEALHLIACDGRQPDLTVFIDVDPSTGLARSTKRLASEGSAEDRFERKDFGFHLKVYAGYRMMGAGNPNWAMVDGSGTPEEVHARVKEAISEKFPDLFYDPAVGLSL